MQIKLIVVAVFALAVTAAPSVFAGTSRDSVEIDGLVLSRCGSQDVMLTGTVSSGRADRLVVTLDGQQVLELNSPNGNWATELINVNPGQHTVTATVRQAVVLDDAVRISEVSEVEEVTDTMEFTVANCPEETPGEETDCCPGPDPITEPEVKGQVKAAVSAKASPSPEVKLEKLPSAGFDVTALMHTLSLWTGSMAVAGLALRKVI